MCTLHLTDEDIRDIDAAHYNNLMEKFSSVIVQVPHDIVKQDNALSAMHYDRYPPFIIDRFEWDGKVPDAVKSLGQCVCEKDMVLDGGWRRGFIDSLVLQVLEKVTSIWVQRAAPPPLVSCPKVLPPQRLPSLSEKKESEDRYATFDRRIPREKEKVKEQVVLNGVRYPMYYGDGQKYRCGGGHVSSMGGICPFDLTELKPTGEPLERV